VARFVTIGGNLVPINSQQRFDGIIDGLAVNPATSIRVIHNVSCAIATGVHGQTTPLRPSSGWGRHRYSITHFAIVPTPADAKRSSSIARENGMSSNSIVLIALCISGIAIRKPD
jgi:hypothetical protein